MVRREITDHDREVCAVKRHYPLRETAESHAHRFNDVHGKTRMRVYQCLVCGRWCTTSDGERKRPKAESRVKSRRRVTGTRLRIRGDARRPVTPLEDDV